MADDFGAPRWALPGPYPVRESEVGNWVGCDGAQVTVFAQYPWRDDERPLPAVVLCHGLGGGHRNYAGLGQHLASRGYAVLHPQFLDSLALAGPGLGLRDVDESAWMRDPKSRELMHTLLYDPQHWVSRANRVHAVLDSIAGQRHVPRAIQAHGALIVGHSYGAYTAQLLLGTRLFGVGLEQQRFTHPAVAGAVLLSPQGSGDRGLTHRSWDGVNLPLLLVTATGDRGPRGEGLSWRREPFDAARSPLKHLAVVRDGDHLLGGLPLPEMGSSAQVRAAVAAVTAAFADRVHGDLAAGAWLASAPFGSLLAHEHQEQAA